MYKGCFALRGDLLLSTVTKVGKNTGRNLRFLHFRARYNAYRIVVAYLAFTEDFLIRFDKKIVSAPAPLPLIPITNSLFGSTVALHERQRRRKKVDSSFATKSTVFCERVV